MIQEAKTKYPVIEFIRKRWSNRAFSDKKIAEKDLMTLFEAASWAPSANNEQPWHYYFAKKEDQMNFDALLQCLNDSNQTWARNADIIVACVIRKTYSNNGKENAWAKHDLGAANYALLIQAESMGIHGHMMAGFNPDKARSVLGLHEDQDPVVMMVLGYVGDPESLTEPFKTRELTERQRKPLEEFTTPLQKADSEKKTEILVLGRNPEIMDIVIRLINQHHGWNGTGVFKDEDAMEKFKSIHYDLVLLGGGIEEDSESKLRKFFKEIKPEIPVIQHYGGGSGLLANEILEALKK